MTLQVHLVDGTYELFRHHFGVPARTNSAGEPVAAAGGVMRTLVSMLEGGATHLGVATDNVIESFRNRMWSGYKTAAGVPPDLLQQFELVELAVTALGIVLWPMVDLEADDALASAAAVCAADPGVGQVLICSPDKDLMQCVRQRRVVLLDRRRNIIIDEAAVISKQGVPPSSIPDWLALVGDSADGFPGIAGWGRRSAAIVLERYPHLEAIPESVADWDPQVTTGLRGAAKLAQILRRDWDLAVLFRQLALLRQDASLLAAPADLHWRGPTADLEPVARRLGVADVPERVRALLAARQATPRS